MSSCFDGRSAGQPAGGAGGAGTGTGGAGAGVSAGQRQPQNSL